MRSGPALGAKGAGVLLAVYAGSFDPVTNGHMWIIQEGAKLFQQLVVAIGVNPGKLYTFSLDERTEMMREATCEYSNVRVDSFSGQYLIRYAQSVGAKYLLRGIRTQGDYEYERLMMYVNRSQCNEIQTVFLIPPKEITELSSSLVKGLVGPQGWEDAIREYVPPGVCARMAKKMPREQEPGS